jgi:hypothetical protein
MLPLFLFSINVWAGTPSEHFLTPACARLFAASEKHQTETWINPSGDIKPAEMMLFDNGLLVVDSIIFSKRMEKRYFQWVKEEGAGTLNITVCDSRVMGFLESEFSNIGLEVLAVDEKTREIFYAVQKVDKHKKIITYTVRNNQIGFGGWVFYKR